MEEGILLQLVKRYSGSDDSMEYRRRNLLIKLM